MPLILICSAALLGLAIGNLVRLDQPALGVAAAIALLGAALARSQPGWRVGALMACAAAAGALRANAIAMPSGPRAADGAGAADAPATALVEPYLGTAVRLRGTLAETPTIGSSGTTLLLVVDARSLAPAGRDPPPDTTDLPTTRLRVVADPSLADGAVGGATAGRPGRPAALDSPEQASAGRETAAGQAPGVGDGVVLEGRLLRADSGRGPPTLWFPRLLSYMPADGRTEMGWHDGAAGQGGTSTPTPTFMPRPAAPTRSDARTMLSRSLADLRTHASQGVHRYLPEPQASLATGVLLGGSGQLDSAFRFDLQRSGLAHLLAIDGYKMVIVAGTVGALASRLLGPTWATLPIWLTIGTYTVLTGAHPSAVRAALMVGLAGAAASTGRPSDPLTSLLLAALAMAAVHPPILLDLGMQLSLSATLGLILLWPRFRRILRRVRIDRRRVPRVIVEPAGLTLAVTLATLPVMLSVFQSISLISPLAHIAAVPLLGPLMISTALLALASPVQTVAIPVSWLTWLPATVLVDITRFAGQLPNAALSTGRLPTLAAVALAVGLVGWGIVGLPELRDLRRRFASARGQTSVRWFAVSGSAALVVLAAALVRPDGQVHVVALEAERGDALFVRGPTGQTALLVRGRPDPVRLTSEVAQQLAVWEHKLDVALPLDPSAEAALGPTLSRYPADRRVGTLHDERIDLGGGAVLDVYVTKSQIRETNDSRAQPAVQPAPAGALQTIAPSPPEALVILTFGQRSAAVLRPQTSAAAGVSAW